jgi:hypothetical protein
MSEVRRGGRLETPVELFTFRARHARQRDINQIVK